jgi:hypothetical protein
LTGGFSPCLADLERQVLSLARFVWEGERKWYLARFAEFYDGGVAAFGASGPGRDVRLAAELWFLLDCPLDCGDTPLQRIRRRETGRAIELLARSELRAWRVSSIDAGGSLVALCPLGTGRAWLELARQPLGSLRAGAILVGRSVPVGPKRWGVLGRAAVVDPAAMASFDALLAVLDAPRGEFWRVHGGVLARAAAAWPEDREHTIDARVVEASLATFALVDPVAAVAALERDGELFDGGGGAGLRRWDWAWDPPRARGGGLARGVRWTLCDEDASARPRLARIIVDLEAGELCVLAPTPPRLALAERLLAERLGPALGEATLREVDPPSVVPRWKRAACEGRCDRWPALARARRAA